ncbi:MAG: hypothetical protein KGP28_10020 [Bdellovibrionales bacterium]|nr:hypothetical protein [Bdellovibrionales bacterium]
MKTDVGREFQVQLKKFLLEPFLFFSLVMIASPLRSSAEDAGVLRSPAYRHEFSLGLGFYSLRSSSSASPLSGIGAFTLGYHYSVSSIWQVEAAFQNIASFSKSGYTSAASGFDLGATYCFFNCSPERSDFPEVGSLSDYDTWGARVSLGFTHRSFTLTSVVVSYTGLYVKPEILYHWSSRWIILGNIYYSNLKNGSASLSLIHFGIGLGLQF